MTPRRPLRPGRTFPLHAAGSGRVQSRTGSDRPQADRTVRPALQSTVAGISTTFRSAHLRVLKNAA